MKLVVLSHGKNHPEVAAVQNYMGDYAAKFGTKEEMRYHYRKALDALNKSEVDTWVQLNKPICTESRCRPSLKRKKSKLVFKKEFIRHISSKLEDIPQLHARRNKSENYAKSCFDKGCLFFAQENYRNAKHCLLKTMETVKYLYGKHDFMIEVVYE